MKRTIKKVLEELNKESPRLDYIRGMLEVLVDGEENSIPIPPNATLNKPEFIRPLDKEITIYEEETIPDSVRPGPVGRVS